VSQAILKFKSGCEGPDIIRFVDWKERCLPKREMLLSNISVSFVFLTLNISSLSDTFISE
jgi:hypothetical protein